MLRRDLHAINGHGAYSMLSSAVEIRVSGKLREWQIGCLQDASDSKPRPNSTYLRSASYTLPLRTAATQWIRAS
jgi:hypothetical protein